MERSNKDELRDLIPKPRYFKGDPDNGGKEVNHWEYWEAMGLQEFFKEHGFNIRATQNINLLLNQRKNFWNEYRNDRKREAQYFHTEEPEDQIRKDFLEKEIRLFTKFLNHKHGEHSDHIKSQINKYLINCREEIVALSKRPLITQCFSWQRNDKQKQQLFDGLKAAGFIDQKTDPINFTAIFSDRPKGCTPVHWTASNRLLSYLFNQMNSGNDPLISSNTWQAVIDKNKLFKNRSGKFLTAQDLATALNSINDPQKGLNPKGHEKINEILKTLRP